MRVSVRRIRFLLCSNLKLNYAVETDNENDDYINADIDNIDYQMRIDPEALSEDGGGDDRRTNSLVDMFSYSITDMVESELSTDFASYSHGDRTYCPYYEIDPISSNMSYFTFD